MASIPCAAYKASSIHDNMRRQSRTRTTSTSSVDSECDSLSSSPSQASVVTGGSMVMQMLRKTTGWTSVDAGRSKSQADMRFVSGIVQNIKLCMPSLMETAENRWIVHTLLLCSSKVMGFILRSYYSEERHMWFSISELLPWSSEYPVNRNTCTHRIIYSH